MKKIIHVTKNIEKRKHTQLKVLAVERTIAIHRTCIVTIQISSLQGKRPREKEVFAYW